MSWDLILVHFWARPCKNQVLTSWCHFLCDFCAGTGKSSTSYASEYLTPARLWQWALGEWEREEKTEPSPGGEEKSSRRIHNQSGFNYDPPGLQRTLYWSVSQTHRKWSACRPGGIIPMAFRRPFRSLFIDMFKNFRRHFIQLPGAPGCERLGLLMRRFVIRSVVHSVGTVLRHHCTFLPRATLSIRCVLLFVALFIDSRSVRIVPCCFAPARTYAYKWSNHHKNLFSVFIGKNLTNKTKT